MAFSFFKNNSKNTEFIKWLKENIPERVQNYEEKENAIKFILKLDEIEKWQEKMLDASLSLTNSEKQYFLDRFLIIFNDIVRYAQELTTCIAIYIERNHSISKESCDRLYKYCDSELNILKGLLSVYNKMQELLLK